MLELLPHCLVSSWDLVVEARELAFLGSGGGEGVWDLVVARELDVPTTWVVPLSWDLVVA